MVSFSRNQVCFLVFNIPYIPQEFHMKEKVLLIEIRPKLQENVDKFISVSFY